MTTTLPSAGHITWPSLIESVRFGIRKKDTMKRKKIKVITKRAIVSQGATALKKLKEAILISPNKKAAMPMD